MFRFFKNIRNKQFREGEKRSTVKYALGEIILVVLGILIALQINNWNETRKERIVEIEILEGIRGDILKDTADINFNIRTYERTTKNDSAFLEHLVQKKAYIPILATYLISIAHGDLNLALHQSHFEEAKQKGLSIIRNKELRAKISRLYEFQYTYLMQLENESQIYDHYKLLNQDVSEYLGYDTSGFIIPEYKYNQLLQDENIHYKIKMASSLKKQLLYLQYYPKLKYALDIVADIDQELEKLR